MNATASDNGLQGHVFIATSLDGFIACRDGSIEWLEDQAQRAAALDACDHGYAGFLAGMDGIVMGRGTFEKVLSFGAWPFEKPVVVLSRSLASTPTPPDLAGRARILELSPREVAGHLASLGWKHAYIDGGRVIQSFLREGLISDLVITRIPVLLGDGLPLFGVVESAVELRHLGTQAFPSGFVQSRYEVAR